MILFPTLITEFYSSGSKWQPTPVLLPGKFHGQRSLVDYSSWDLKESDTTERLYFTLLYFTQTHPFSLPLPSSLQSHLYTLFPNTFYVSSTAPGTRCHCPRMRASSFLKLSHRLHLIFPTGSSSSPAHSTSPPVHSTFFPQIFNLSLSTGFLLCLKIFICT